MVVEVSPCTTATRRGFERAYDLTERVIPALIQAIPTPDEADAQRHLIGIAAQLNAEGKCLEFSAPNALVSEWLEALGLPAVASIVPRRA